DATVDPAHCDNDNTFRDGYDDERDVNVPADVGDGPKGGDLGGHHDVIVNRLYGHEEVARDVEIVSKRTKLSCRHHAVNGFDCGSHIGVPVVVFSDTKLSRRHDANNRLNDDDRDHDGAHNTNLDDDANDRLDHDGGIDGTADLNVLFNDTNLDVYHDADD